MVTSSEFTVYKSLLNSPEKDSMKMKKSEKGSLLFHLYKAIMDTTGLTEFPILFKVYQILEPVNDHAALIHRCHRDPVRRCFPPTELSTETERQSLSANTKFLANVY